MEQNIDVLEEILDEVNELAGNEEDDTEYTQNIDVLKAILDAVESIANKTLVQYVKSASVSTERAVDLDMEGYEYDESDIINVFIDGKIGVEDTDWSLDDSVAGSEAVTIAGTSDADVVITVLKMEG